jgi:hypothetical protein
LILTWSYSWCFSILLLPLSACATGISLLALIPTHPPLLLVSHCQRLAAGILLLESRCQHIAFPTVTNCHLLLPLPAYITGTFLSTPHLLSSSWYSNSQFRSPGTGTRHIRSFKDIFFSSSRGVLSKINREDEDTAAFAAIVVVVWYNHHQAQCKRRSVYRPPYEYVQHSFSLEFMPPGQA